MQEERIREVLEKQLAADNERTMGMNQAQCGTNATIGGALGMAAKNSLRNRIHRKLMSTEEAREQHNLLGELEEHLLDKHPDVARILELLDLTKGAQ